MATEESVGNTDDKATEITKTEEEVTKTDSEESLKRYRWRFNCKNGKWAWRYRKRAFRRNVGIEWEAALSYMQSIADVYIEKIKNQMIYGLHIIFPLDIIVLISELVWTGL